MLLSRLTGVIKFCSNLFLSFLLMVCILLKPSCSKSLFMHSFQFPWLAIFPFLSCFNFHGLMQLGIDVSMHDMVIPLQTALKYHILNHGNNTNPITNKINQHPINQSHPTHPDRMMLHHTTLPHLHQ